MTAQEPPRPLAGLEQAAHLHSLAERIHQATDDLPAPESTHSLASISEDVEDQARVIAGVFASLAHEAAVHGRAAKQHPGAADALAHRKVALMTRAADPLGWALAKLGEAVAQIGRLHEISAGPRTPERVQAIDTARAALHDRLFSAHRHLTDAAGNLHRDADLLVAAASGSRRHQLPRPLTATGHLPHGPCPLPCRRPPLEPSADLGRRRAIPHSGAASRPRDRSGEGGNIADDPRLARPGIVRTLEADHPPPPFLRSTSSAAPSTVSPWPSPLPA